MKTKPFKSGLLKELCDEEYAVEYLTQVLQHESPEAFLIALKNVIEAREKNVSELASDVGISRQGLYKMLSEDGNPRLSTLNELLKSLGMKISITGGEAA